MSVINPPLAGPCSWCSKRFLLAQMLFSIQFGNFHVLPVVSLCLCMRLLFIGVINILLPCFALLSFFLRTQYESVLSHLFPPDVFLV